ncbi:conserved hypothetical protein [Verrucomicrobiia bacterium DG1235]|nr:conserved hypothetical protein [Verrucomicrobiae bacterium DG1235]
MDSSRNTDSSPKLGLLHPRNPHQGRYDFAALVAACPELAAFLRPNPKGDQTIDFGDEGAVRALNGALLAHHYGVKHWMIPMGYLCPPIPGRADVIHYLADLLSDSNGGEIPRGKRVRALDIGTGANCIYPILGSRSYGWQFVGTDIDNTAVKTARLIVESNACLRKLIKVVQQKNRDSIFKGIIRPDDRFDLTLCNPPFHGSAEEAQAANQRKRSNLSKGSRVKKTDTLNFGGQQAELWCAGGELRFVSQMIRESVAFGEQVGWFSSLISKSEHLPALKKELGRSGASQVEVLEMRQGQKVSRLLAWRF